MVGLCLAVIQILLWLYGKCRFRSSSLWNSCFPCYPLSKFLRGDHCTDLFLQIMSVNTAKCMWAHITQVSKHPNALNFHGQLDIPDITYVKGFCCFNFLDINWNDTLLTDHLGKEISLPKRAYIVFHDTGLSRLDRMCSYEITLQARYLGCIYTITRTSYSPPENMEAMFPDHHVVDVVI